jgi:NADH-quinone oxidoreductase subunit M
MATLGLGVWLMFDFDRGISGYQATENHVWIKDLGIHFSLGVDGISLFLVVLTALLFPISILISESVKHNQRSFVAWLLVLQSAVTLVFCARDVFVFFVGFELVLIPMYFLIAGFGHGDSKRVALKFFLFTMGGSIFYLASMFTLASLYQHSTGHWSFAMSDLMNFASTHISHGTSMWLFAGFAIAFAVKVPLFPLHTWLPDAHTEAPTAGSIILAGVLLKLGTYGFIRIAFAFFPYAAHKLAWVLLLVSVIGIIYGAIVATMQPDLKRLVAYSSIAHLGFVVLGIVSLTDQGMSGAVFTMVSHGLTTGALFVLVGMLYDRRHTREISAFGGIWKSAPVLGGAFLIATFASIGLPGFSGFVGEFLSMLGAFSSHRWYVMVAATGVIFAALYLLWAFQRVFTGEPEGENAKMRDVTFRELICIVPLLGLSLLMGLAPQFFFDRVNPSVKKLDHHIAQYSTQHTKDTPASSMGGDE